MSMHIVDRFGANELVIQNQHPAMRLHVMVAQAAVSSALPAAAGIYVLMSSSTQRCYVGETGDFRDRIPVSLGMNMPNATQVVLAYSTGLAWSEDQRRTVESMLIECLPGTLNKDRGTRRSEADEYLAMVVSYVHQVCALLLPLAACGDREVPSQAKAARQIVLGEEHHPLTRAEVVSRLQDLGWPMTGQTAWATLRRDLKDERRGGSPRICATGRWNEDATLIYVKGRRYRSGWKPRTTCEAPLES